ncbi:MAG: GNAT family N-acetyltransferase, partial [Opitutae bacterium]|nr:GNAT family N-acetyltransferase [Opitutae bacterium]
MTLERVESAEPIAAVAALAREIWTQHYVPIIGAAQVEYMLEKFQSAEAIARQLAGEGYEY